MSEKRAWLPTTEVVKEYGNCRIYWLKQAKAGNVVAFQGRKFLFERVSIEAFLTGTKVKSGETANQRELRKLNEDTELLEAKRKNKMARLGFDSIAEFERVKEALEPDRQEIERAKGVIAEAKEKMESIKEIQEEFRQAGDALKEWQKSIRHDVKKFKEYYDALRATGKIEEIPFLNELELSDRFYCDKYADVVKAMDLFKAGPDVSSFDEGEGEGESHPD